jgi:hypothetical protein
MIVISYFCGGGGNRYQYHLENNEYYKKDGYCHQFQHPMELFELTNETPAVINKENIQHTHCLNTTLIKKVFPAHKIIKIKTDLESTTYRGWSLLKNNKQMTRIERTGNAFIWIRCVNAYYKNYPIDWKADILIDTEKQDCEFSKIFWQELHSYKICDEWKIAKQAYDEFGEDAPIIDLAKEVFQQQYPLATKVG